MRKVKWFVTTTGYKDIFVIAKKRFGEYAGKFLCNSRCIGYFDTEKEAVQCVLENWGDIFEFSYCYAIIESHGSGIYPHDSPERTRFFWWYAGKYIEINRPHWAQSTCNWGIG